MKLLCKESRALAMMDYFLDDHNSDDNETENIYNFLDNNKPEFPMHICHHESKSISCKEAFIPILTEDGICYSFNILDRKDIYRNNV